MTQNYDRPFGVSLFEVTREEMAKATFAEALAIRVEIERRFVELHGHTDAEWRLDPRTMGWYLVSTRREATSPHR